MDKNGADGSPALKKSKVLKFSVRFARVGMSSENNRSQSHVAFAETMPFFLLLRHDDGSQEGNSFFARYAT